jgi:hypothetical protein
VSASSNVEALSVNAVHVATLHRDGTVQHGRFIFGDFIPGDPVDTGAGREVNAVAAGPNFLMLLKHDGAIAVIGDESLAPPPDLDHAVAIAAGFQHCVALTAEGRVVAWGVNDAGQCNVPLGLQRVTAIAAGTYHTVALKDDGTVVSWGKVASDVVAGAPLWDAYVPVGLRGATAIAAGGHNTMALLGTPQVPVISITRSPEGIVGIWPASKDPFELVQSGRKEDSFWNPVATPVISNGLWNQALLPMDSDTKLFRLVLGR